MADDTDPAIEAARIEARERQYEAYVQWAERLVDRRAEANKFYMTLNVAIVGAIGFLYSDRFNGAGPLAQVEWVASAFAFAGLVISFTWRCIIASQRRLLGEKFEVIHRLEEALPFQPYTDEYADGNRKAGGGRFELRLPSLFMVFYVVAITAFALQLAGLGLSELMELARERGG